MNIKHDKSKVLKSGIELFWCKGYSNLGVDEICKTTGMTKGAFYNAYKSKENFLMACIETYGVMNTKYLKEQLSDTNTKAIDRLLHMYTTLLENQPKKQFIGCMMNNMMSEIGSLNVRVSNATGAAFEDLLQVVEPEVKKAQIEGDISSSLSSKAVAELLHSSFFGVLTRIKSTRDYENGVSTMDLLIKSLKNI